MKTREGQGIRPMITKNLIIIWLTSSTIQGVYAKGLSYKGHSSQGSPHSFELHTASQFSWITLKGMHLKALVHEAHKEE